MLGAEFLHDINVSYKFPWNGKLMAGINNMFDKQPRIAYQVAGVGQASSSSVDPDQSLGRFFYVRYNQSF
jgi:iron complex outermembrane recepter protein